MFACAKMMLVGGMTTFPFAENYLSGFNGIARVFGTVARVLLCGCQGVL